MATYDYSAIEDNVARPLIVRFGTTVTVTRTEDTTVYEKEYDPITFSYYWIDKVTGQRFDSQPGSTTKTYNGLCVLTAFTEEEIDNTNILSGDKKLLAIDIPEPKQGDLFTLINKDGSTTTYKYINNKPVAPHNIAVVHRVQVRV